MPCLFLTAVKAFRRDHVPGSKEHHRARYKLVREARHLASEINALSTRGALRVDNAVEV
jgi:hypothetical protein